MLQAFSLSDRPNDRKTQSRVDSCLVSVTIRTFVVVAMTLSTSGQRPREHEGSLEPDGDTERNPQAAPLPIPSFTHRFTFRTLPGGRAGAKQLMATANRTLSGCEVPVASHRAQAHTEPGTSYTIRKGAWAQPLKIKAVHYEARDCSPSPQKAPLPMSNSLMAYSS